MITPRFRLSQDDKTFTITIRAPYCSLKELDVQVDEETFLFYCKPYHLRITLPGKIESEETAHSKFDSDLGEFEFTYCKINAGEHFPNLEFITNFLTPKLEVQKEGRKIEIVTSTTEPDVVESQEQYGFAQRGGYKFNFVSMEFCDIFELNPYEIPLRDRKAIRLKREEELFNSDHYCADYIDCDEIDSLISQQSPWKQKVQDEKFTSAELDYLKDLPNITYELSKKQEQYAFVGLLDILYAYCYDQRTTCYESTCESGWTILKLSATLNSFAAFDTSKEVIVSAFRRALIFPLYRNFKLCLKIFEDLKELLKFGETELIKILIKIHEIFLGGDSARYILNHLFIKDYIIYIQKWNKHRWAEILNEVKNLQIVKDDLGLNLEYMERLLNENETQDDLEKKLTCLSISNNQKLDSDDSEDSTSDSESDDSSTSSSSSSEEEKTSSGEEEEKTSSEEEKKQINLETSQDNSNNDKLIKDN